jgi:hypothetical protein
MKRGGKLELRPLKAGRAHLAIPFEHRRSARALAWILAILREPERTARMAAPL